MKLLRFGPVGQERPGVLDADGAVRDLTGAVPDFAGPHVALETLSHLHDLNISALPLVADPGRIGACLGWVPNFICIGLNYAQHAAETGAATPKEPIVFNKVTSALAGPFDDLTLLRDSVATDWEVELGVVIGRPAQYVSEAKALSHVAGYCTLNDISERDWQKSRGGQWVKGKSGPGYGPIGPWLVTADEVPDPQALRLTLDLDGQRMQDSATSDMIFSVAEIIAYLSRFCLLMPGDIIATGTPSGVGMGMSPARYLKPGEIMEAEVEGLGRQRTQVRAAD
ncbi:MAG: fumarylacetoacetate hydrolase family protein [Rhodobacteraceae bacterium]|nr:fumarylacetoacetate hydrolase family protein [Paracoccaceae bacterium]